MLIAVCYWFIYSVTMSGAGDDLTQGLVGSQLINFFCEVVMLEKMELHCDNCNIVAPCLRDAPKEGWYLSSQKVGITMIPWILLCPNCKDSKTFWEKRGSK